MDLSVVIVSWNTRDLLLECLAALERRQSSTGRSPLVQELLVVDNGSEDGSATAVREHFPGVRLIELSDNIGFAAGCNAGIREARGRHVLLLNSDAVVCDGALERCVAYLDANPRVGIVGPQLLNPDGSKQNSIHNFPRVATEFIPKGAFQFLFRRRFPSRRWTDDEPLEVEAIVGAALFVRRQVIEGVGGLAEDYFFFLEETDWCWRVRDAGWRVHFLPTAFVKHLSGASSKKKNPALTRIEYHRSLYHFYRKHRGSGWMLTVLLLRLSKAFLYVLTQAPLALSGGRHAARWMMHRDVLIWHLRGCPSNVGVFQVGDSSAGKPMLEKTAVGPSHAS
jgi:hypothetical protein